MEKVRREFARQIILELKWFDHDSIDGQEMPCFVIEDDDPLSVAVKGLQATYHPYKTLPLPGQGHWRRFLDVLLSMEEQIINDIPSGEQIQRFFDLKDDFQMWISSHYSVEEYPNLDSPQQENPNKPRWDSEERKLWWGKILCKKYRQSAERQEPILDAFQKQGWPKRIKNPLPSDVNDDIDPNQKLKDAIRRLNENPQLVFKTVGKDDWILWAPKNLQK